MTTPSTMAASILCAGALRGPRMPLTLVHRSREAWLLARPGHRSVLSLVTPRAVRLPQSLLLPDLPSGWCEMSIGAGFLWYGDNPVSVRRWFTPSRVTRGALSRQAAASARAGRLIAGWRDHLGRGEGLTPYGDDVLCGLMLGLIATDDERAGWLAQEIKETDLESRTTAPSAALLRCAADGWCIPEVESLLVALSSGRPAADAARRLRSVGHSSGRGLGAGLAAVLGAQPPAVAA